VGFFFLSCSAYIEPGFGALWFVVI